MDHILERLRIHSNMEEFRDKDTREEYGRVFEVISRADEAEGGSLDLVELWGAGPLGYHQFAEQSLVALEGQAVLAFDDHVERFNEGARIVLPANALHAVKPLRHSYKRPFRFLAITSPAWREEDEKPDPWGRGRHWWAGGKKLRQGTEPEPEIFLDYHASKLAARYLPEMGNLDYEDGYLKIGSKVELYAAEVANRFSERQARSLVATSNYNHQDLDIGALAGCEEELSLYGIGDYQRASRLQRCRLVAGQYLRAEALDRVLAHKTA